MIVIPGPASQKLGEKVAQLIHARVVSVDLKTFPDGESKIRIADEVEGEEVVIIQSTGPPQDTHLMQLFLMIDAARGLGAKKIVAVVPYLAYARQDKRFLPGEAVSIHTVIKLLEASGTDGFLTVNTHEESILRKLNVPAKNLSAISLLSEYFRNKGLGEAFCLAPDKGSLELVQEASKALSGGFGCLEKKRNLYTGEISVEAKKFDVEGKDVIIFDDIISTGRTIINATKVVKKQGAGKVYAACVHPLLVGKALDKIVQSGVKGIIGTDCVSSSTSLVSVAPLIAEALSQRGV